MKKLESAAGMEQANVAVVQFPKSFKQAMQREDAPEWLEACVAELGQHDKNGTMQLCALPPAKRALPCKWVFVIKFHADGTLQRYKARLVIMGNFQKEGIDFTETFAPTIQHKSIRVILAIANECGYELHQMDVTCAFLYGDIEEEVYMQQPEGFVVKGQEHMVYRVRKSIYGMRQSPLRWYEKIAEKLMAFGFTRCTADYGVFVLQNAVEHILVGVYVDDLLIASKTKSGMQWTKTMLKNTFEMKDLGEASYILGIQIARDREQGTLLLSQPKYIKEMAERFEMQDAGAYSNPVDKTAKLSKMQAPRTEEQVQQMKGVPYQQLVGSLMYTMVATRPDIAYAVGACARYLSNYGQAHWAAAKRVLRYLLGTPHKGLLYARSGQGVLLTAYTDSDHAMAWDDRRSTGGYVMMVGGAAVSWSSKKQKSVTISSAEAEFVALSMAASEVIWMRHLLAELGFPQRQATILHCDNQAAISLAKNPEHREKTKHVDVRLMFVREHIKHKEIQLEYCGTENMLADILTKGVPNHQFVKLVQGIGLWAL